MGRLWSAALAVCFMMSADLAHALELRWHGGGTEISALSAVRCTLEVRADSNETRLPAEWRLLWCADSSAIELIAPDSASACVEEEAKVLTIEGPVTRADSAAHLTTAHFCSDDEDFASIAYQVVDLPAAGKGKLKAVALDVLDSGLSRLVASNEVTYNGGVEGAYPPVLLRATSVHQSIQLEATGSGFGLDQATTMRLMAADSSWDLPLEIVSKDNPSIVGSDTVTALLPACQLVVETADGVVSVAPLDADPEPDGVVLGGCASSYHEGLLSPPPSPLGYTIQPKDFAFARGFVNSAGSKFQLHLFYIRHNYWYYQPPNNPAVWHPELDEKNIGHIWTDNFNTWAGRSERT